MKKILLKTLVILSIMFLTSSIASAGSKAKKDHPEKGNQHVGDVLQDGEDVEVAPNVKSDNPVKQLSHSGIIKGIVKFCEADEQSLNEGILVYIPGRSFMAKTGESGEFELSYVPKGIYNLIVEIPDQAPYEISDVEVMKKRITDLGEIVACDDDGDGFYLDDCDDSNPNINPGAVEMCDDKVDNDCDRKVDEVECVVCTDGDGDGFYVEGECGEEIDCDDTDAEINPGVDETCDDRIDNNCNGTVDEEACKASTQPIPY